jgi:hypothetical protein
LRTYKYIQTYILSSHRPYTVLTLSLYCPWTFSVYCPYTFDIECVLLLLL